MGRGRLSKQQIDAWMAVGKNNRGAALVSVGSVTPVPTCYNYSIISATGPVYIG